MKIPEISGIFREIFREIIGVEVQFVVRLGTYGYKARGWEVETWEFREELSDNIGKFRKFLLILYENSKIKNRNTRPTTYYILWTFQINTTRHLEKRC